MLEHRPQLRPGNRSWFNEVPQPADAAKACALAPTPGRRNWTTMHGVRQLESHQSVYVTHLMRMLQVESQGKPLPDWQLASQAFNSHKIDTSSSRTQEDLRCLNSLPFGHCGTLVAYVRSTSHSVPQDSNLLKVHLYKSSRPCGHPIQYCYGTWKVSRAHTSSMETLLAHTKGKTDQN